MCFNNAVSKYYFLNYYSQFAINKKFYSFLLLLNTYYECCALFSVTIVARIDIFIGSVWLEAACLRACCALFLRLYVSAAISGLTVVTVSKSHLSCWFNSADMYNLNRK
jgi:hypothetical protein